MNLCVDLESTTSVLEVADVVRNLARSRCRADGATFVLREDDYCYYVDEDAISPLWKGQRFPIRSCISGWAMLHGEPAVVRDVRTDFRIPQAAYRPTFVRSLLMAPVEPASPIAAVGVYWASRHTATREQIRTLIELASQTAEALDRVGLEDAPWAPNFGLN